MLSSKMAPPLIFLMLVGAFAQDNFLSKKDLDRMLSEGHPEEGTFAAARPGTCCTVEPHTRLAWSEFKTTASFLQGLHDGAIVVPCGHEVTVDESFGEDHPVGLQVLGSLKFQDGIDLRIVVSYVFVCGDFAIGSPESPHESDLEIILRTGEYNFMWVASEMTGHHGEVAAAPALPSPHDAMHDDMDDSDDHNNMPDDHNVDEIMPEIDDDEDMPMTGEMSHDDNMHPVMTGHVHSNFGKAPFVTYGGSMYINGAQCGKTSWTRLRRTVEPAVDPTINIARGRSATQSSYDSRHPTWSDGRGTDGSYHWRHGSVETRNELNPWWTLVLDGTKNVQTVVVEDSRRASQLLKDARVVVSSEPCEQGALCPGQACTYKREFRKSTKGAMQYYKFEEFDCEGAAGSYVHLQIEGQGKIYFSEMEVYEATTEEIYELELQPPAAVAEEETVEAEPSTINIARGRSATQSSKNRRHSTWSNGRGTDGNYHWKWGSVETQNELNPWWSVVLDEPTRVDRVVVEAGGRADDWRVVVSNEPCEQGALCPGQACTYRREFRKAERGRMRYYKFEEFDCAGATGSYVHLQIEGQGTLYFSEMEVFESTTAPSSAAAVSWRVGDRIVIAPSGRNSGEYDHDLHIVAVEGNVLTVRGRMSYTHLGCDASDEDCVEAAEVASLSRNVRIRGSDDCGDSNSCGHFMIAHTNTGTVCGAEFTNMGQKETEGRYPLHMHLPGDSPDIVLKSNVLAFNRNRGIVLHGTNQALVDSNVVYNTNGHCVMLEDAIEQENRIINNLAMDPQRQNFGCSHSHDGTFTCPDRTDGSPNAFWISNPNNYFEDNVGIAPGAAYFFATRHVFGLTRRKFSKELQRSGLANGKVKGMAKVLSFKNNLAHSSSMGMGNYPKLSHNDGTPVVYEGFTAWRCGGGQQARGKKFEFRNSRLIKNNAATVSGMVDQQIKIYNSQLLANGLSGNHQSSGKPMRSAPMVWKLLGLSNEAKIRSDFWVDDATKAWTLEHGGYDWDALREWRVGILFEE